MHPDAVELRILGCLIEKRQTTPDQYPLSLNALRLACNQSTNREPVVDYDEPTIRGALTRLGHRSWVRLASGAGDRVAKYEHLLEEELTLSLSDLAVTGVLMLRGPQTPGELKTRCERLYPFGSIGDVLSVLDRLIERRLVARLDRRPGQKEERYAQLIGGPPGETAAAAVTAPVTVAAPSVDDDPVTDRLAALEARVDRLEDELRAILDRLP